MPSDYNPWAWENDFVNHREILGVYHSIGGHSLKSIEVTSNLMVDKLSRSPNGRPVRSLEVTSNLGVEISYIDKESLFSKRSMILEKAANGWTVIGHHRR